MLKVKEKIAYGLGDTASNIVYQTIVLFLAFFYTDIFGLSPTMVGIMFLAIRVFDAVTDPLMGALNDRTNTKWGKFRPYLLWLAIPFGVISVLTFTTPDLSDQGKIIYAFVTYTLLMVAYTAINIPYSALGSVLTPDPEERVSVQSYRFVFGMLGGLIVTACTLPLVEWFGQGDQAKGYQYTIAAMSLIGIVMFLVCFAGTKERVFPPKNQKSSLKNDLKSLWKNDQWRILCLAALFVLVGGVLRNTLAIYYVKYFLERSDLITLFVTLGMLGNIAGCAFSPWLSKRFCKIKVYQIVHLLAATLSVLSFFIESQQIILAIAVHVLWCFTSQIGTPLLWAKMADLVDYGHWKTGTRITGMMFSSVVFFIKLGLALGGALSGFLLAYYGYQADIIQADDTKTGILVSFALIPAFAYIIVAVIMQFYTLTSEKINKIQINLKEKELLS